jgi:hypothetical protein
MRAATRFVKYERSQKMPKEWKAPKPTESGTIAANLNATLRHILEPDGYYAGSDHDGIIIELSNEDALLLIHALWEG